MKRTALFSGMFCLLLTGCSSSGLAGAGPDVTVEVVNQSSNNLQNAKARFGDYACEWGYVAKAGTAVYMSYPHPITAQTELQRDEGGKLRVEKIDLSKIYTRGKSGRLTFTVYDDRVEVNFREKS